MKGYIDALVNYALERGLIQEGDEIWAYNRLLEVLGLDEAEGEPVEAELAEILDKLTDDAVRRGLIDDNITARDLFDTKLMGAILPPPHEVRAIFEGLRADYPEAALVAEWSRPDLSLPAGFDMDFILNDPHTHYASLLRDYNAPVDNTFFRRAAPDRDINRYLDVYLRWYEDTRDTGYICMPTCNHDTVRPSYRLEEAELKLAYAFLFTMPGVPFLYYGDEIGMRYQILRTKEGGFQRTGTRTPMQWDNTKNLGFSEADAAALYLPVDPAADAPTVAGQERDPDSLLNFVRSVLALRHREADLQADAPFELLSADPEKPLLYRRGGLLAALNPSDKALACPAPVGDREPIFTFGSAAPAANALELGPQSFVVLR